MFEFTTPDGPAWSECIEHFLEDVYRRSSSEASRHTYRHHLTRFFIDLSRSPASYTRQDVARFLEWQSSYRGFDQRPGVSTATRNLRMTIVNSLYKFASAYEVDGKPLYDHASPTAGLAYGKPAIKYKAFTSAELDRFWASFDRTTTKGKRDYALFWFYFLTCRRKSEVYLLKWGDFERATIMEQGHPRVSWVYKFSGKGHHQETDRAEVPASAMEAIIDYLKACGRYDTMRPDSYIFARLWKGGSEHPLHGDYCHLLLKDQLKVAGLDSSYSIHSFRHSSARERISAGEDIRSVQRALRHSSLAVTDRYVSLLVSSADPGARLLEARYGR